MKLSRTLCSVVAASCFMAMAWSFTGCSKKKEETAQAPAPVPRDDGLVDTNKKPSAPSSAPSQDGSQLQKPGGDGERGPSLAGFSTRGGGAGGGEKQSSSPSRGPTLMSAGSSGNSSNPGETAKRGDGHTHGSGNDHDHSRGPASGPAAAGASGGAGSGGPPRNMNGAPAGGGPGTGAPEGSGGPPRNMNGAPAGTGAEGDGFGTDYGAEMGGGIPGGGPPRDGMEGDPAGNGGVSAPGFGGDEEGGGYPGGLPGAGPGFPGGPGAGPGFPGGPGGGPGAAPGGNPAASNEQTAAKKTPKSEGLLGQAEEAMAEGREGAAFQYLYALALSNDESDLFDKYGWVGGLRRPTLAVRWAIGVNVKISPRSYNGSLHPIGSNQNLPQRNSRRGGGFADPGGGPGGPGGFPGAGPGPGLGGMGGMAGMGGGGTRSSRDSLADFAGELGTGTVEVLVERVEGGSFGAILAHLAQFVQGQSPGSTPSGQSGGGMAGPGMGPGMGPGGPAGLDAGLGGPAGMEGAFGDEGGVDEGEEDFGEPDLGAGAGGGQGAAGPSPARGRGGDGHNHQHGPGGGNRAAGNSRRSAVASNEPPQFAAGVIYLGTGTASTLKRKAAQQGVDVLLLFDVDVSRNSRTGVVRTTTKATIYDVYKNSALVKLKSLSNIKVQNERAKGDDPVNDWIDDLVAKIDDTSKGLVMTDLPAGLKPEHAKGRVERLAADYASAPGNPLPILTEIAFYYHRKLIDDELRTRVYQQILGKEAGEKLSLGNAQERLDVLQRWMPKD